MNKLCFEPKKIFPTVLLLSHVSVATTIMFIEILPKKLTTS